MLNGILPMTLLVALMRLAPLSKRVGIAKAFIRFSSGTDHCRYMEIEAAVLGLVPAAERNELLLASALGSPSSSRLKDIASVIPDEAVRLLGTNAAANFCSDVLLMLARSSTQGSAQHRAKAIDSCIARSNCQLDFLPRLAIALRDQNCFVDSAALVSALMGMGHCIEGLEGAYIKGCVLLGEYDTAFRYCSKSVELQRILLSCLLDNNSTRDACNFLANSKAPENILDKFLAARLVEQLGQRSMEGVDPIFFQIQIRSITELLMRAQGQCEVDIGVASALGSCGQWELCLTFFDRCTTLQEMERLLVSAARGGAPFESIRPFVVAVSKSNLSLTRNGLREILIRCAAEAGDVDEALALFRIAKQEGSSDLLLDHPHMVGHPECGFVPFSAISLLRAGRWEDAKARIVTYSEREAWENYVVEHGIVSQLHALSVGSAIRMLVRLSGESKWRHVLEEYFPSIELSTTTRQWVSHFIAGRLVANAGAEEACLFLKSYSRLSDEDALMLLHVTAPTADILTQIVRRSWRWGMVCLRHNPPSILPKAWDIAEVIRGWSAEESKPPRVYVRLIVSVDRRRRGYRPPALFLRVAPCRLLDDTSPEMGVAEADAFSADDKSPTHTIFLDICRGLGGIPASEVLTRWARLLTQHHLTSATVGVWIEACVADGNIAAALEVMRLSGIAQITPPLKCLLALVSVLDFGSQEGRDAIHFFRQLPSSDPLLRAVGYSILKNMALSETDLFPAVASLCGYDMPLGDLRKNVCSFITAGGSCGVNVVPTLPFDVVMSLCEKREGRRLSCDFFAFGESSMLLAQSGTPKQSLFESFEAASRSIFLIYKRREIGLWRVVVDAMYVLAEERPDIGRTNDRLVAISRGLTLLALSDVSPADMLSVLAALRKCPLEFNSSNLTYLHAKVLVGCFFSFHNMPSEAAKQLTEFEDEIAILEVARIIFMLPTPSLRALAWVRLDAVAMRFVFGPERVVIGPLLRSLIGASSMRDSVSYRWLMRPAFALLDVGEATSQTDAAFRAVETFESRPSLARRRVRIRAPSGQ